MSTITSASTLEDIQAVYLDGCGYREDANRTKARSFCTACRALLLMLPSRVAQSGDQDVSFDMGRIQRELREAEQWLADNSGYGATDRVVGYVDNDFRGTYGRGCG